MNTPLGKVGRITYMFQGTERVTMVERSTGRHAGYKTEKILLKKLKESVERMSQRFPIVSVEVLTIAMVSTNVQLINVGDL